MATFNSREIQKLFVGGLAGNATAAIDAMPAGEIGIFTPGGTRITAASAATEDRFVIVQSRGAGQAPLRSGVIDKTKVQFKANARLYAAATQMIDAFGFNGSTGSIEAINDNLYMTNYNLSQELVSNHGGLYLKHGVYKSSLAATQAEIATGLAGSIINNFSREPERILYPEVLLNVAGTGAAGFTTLDVVQGSKIVVTNNTFTSLVAGDYIRINAGVTNACYLVVNNTPGTGTTRIIELAYAYQGATATVAVANVIRITAAQAATADAGVRATGVSPSFVVGKMSNRVIRWVTTLRDFGTTTYTVLQVANEGNGTERQVQELEWFTQGNEGDFLRMGEPNIFPSRAEAAGIYDLIHINTTELYTGSITSGPIKQEFTLAIPEATPTYALTATTNGITNVLEVLIYGATNGNLSV
jgi:hypothetical protein